MNITKQELKNALTEWDRLWRENPDEFQDISTFLAEGNSETYGEEATPFLLWIIKSMRKQNITGGLDLSEWNSNE